MEAKAPIAVFRITRDCRIERGEHGLEPLIASGQLLFSRKHTTLLEQLRQFPLGAHDDGPDALEMAVTEAVEGPQRVGGGRTIGMF